MATGGFTIDDAVTLDALEESTELERDAKLLPIAVLVAHLPPLRVNANVARLFLQGRAVQADDQRAGAVAVFDGDSLLGIADVAAGIASPRRVVPAQRS